MEYGNFEIDEKLMDFLDRRRNKLLIETKVLSAESYGALMGFVNRQGIEIELKEVA